MYQIILNKRLDTYFIRMNILLCSIGDYLMQTLKIKTFVSLDTSKFQVIIEYSFFGIAYDVRNNENTFFDNYRFFIVKIK